MRYLRACCTCIALVLGMMAVMARPAAAQTTATITAPSDGAVDVSIIPLITIRTGMKIDTTSITMNYGHGDSADAPLLGPPSVRLLPKILADSLPDSLLSAAAVHGSYMVLNDTTLVFTPSGNLAYGVEYRAEVASLRLVNTHVIGPGGFPVVDADHDTITFTTTFAPYAQTMTSVSATSLARCGDTLWARFNRKLEDTSSPTGSYFTLDRFDSIHIVSDTVTTLHTSRIDGDVWLEGDSTRIFFRPKSPLTPGGRYYLNVLAGKLSGDTVDDVHVPFRVKEAYTITMTAVDIAHPGTPLSGGLISHAGASVHDPGDSVWIGAVTDDSAYAFVRWECPAYPDIDSAGASAAAIVQECSSMHDLAIRAVFVLRDTISVTLHDSAGMRVVAYRYDTTRHGFDSVGAAGTYLLAPGEELHAIAFPTAPGIAFAAWHSDVPEYNGSEKPIAVFRNTGTIHDLINHWPAGVAATEYGLCTQVLWEDSYATDIDPASVISIVPAPGSCVISNTQDPIVVTGTIASECYELSDVVVHRPAYAGIVYNIHFPEGSGVRLWRSNMAPFDGTLSGDLGLVLTDPKTIVEFVVRPKMQKLVVQTELLDNRTLDYGQIGRDRDVRIGVWTVKNGKPATFRWYTSNGSIGQGLVTDENIAPLSFVCGEIVEARMEGYIGEEGYSFEGWVNTLGYTYPSPMTYLFRFEMDQDRKIRGQMREHFRLRKIAFYRDDATSTPTWYTTRALRNMTIDDANVWLAEDVGNAIHYGTRMRLLFNDPVNLATLAHGLYAADQSERIDYPEVGSIDPSTRLTYLGVSSNISATANGDREIAFDLMANGAAPGLPRGEEFALTATNSIRSTSSQTLWNPGVYHAVSELPGLEIRWESLTVRGSAGDFLAPSPEPYTIYAAAFGEAGTDGVEPDPSAPPTVVPVTTVAYGPGGGPLILLDVAKGFRSDVAQLMFASYDDDGPSGVSDGFVNSARFGSSALLSAAGGVLKFLEAALSLPVLGTLALVCIALSLVDLLLGGPFWRFVGGIFINNDDTMGSYMWNYRWLPGQWFGGHPSQHAGQHRPATDNDIVGYDVDFKLKK